MINRNFRRPVALALGVAIAGSLGAASVANANPFSLTSLGSAYMAAEGAGGADKGTHEGKCGEGKCGADKAKGEGKCGADKAKGEGKCGEGKCGAGMKDGDKKEGEKKEGDKA
jgi:uncharacterized low-complexity protein